MINHSIKVLLLVFSLLFGMAGAEAVQGDWPYEVKDTHFIVLYKNNDHKNFAQSVLRRAEEYYYKIAYQIGYQRYQNYWTWDNRVKIYLFPDHLSYVAVSGAPFWSKALVSSNHHIFEKNSIITYTQEPDFMEDALPHEISHLMLRDFIGEENTIPVWFDEGVAQLQQSERLKIKDQLIKSILAQGKQYPLSELHTTRIANEFDQTKVVIFYVESLSIIDFLIRKYGHDRFKQLCLEMKNGRGLVEALGRVYYSIDSLNALEEKWISYVQTQQI